MLDYTNTQAILEIAEGKSALKAGPVTQGGITISRGDEIRYGIQFSVTTYKVVGFASSKTWMLAYFGNLDDYNEADNEDKTTPAVILKNKWDDYKIVSAKDAASQIKANKQFDAA